MASVDRRPGDMTPAQPESDLGSPEAVGDPACWLAQVCPDCGRLNDERYADVCGRCGADLPAAG